MPPMNMDDPARASRARMRPSGLLGMLIAITAIELVVAHHKLDLTPIVGIDWNQVGRRLERSVRENEILCFGDSMIRHGVLPRVIQQRTGRRCLSLAVAAGQAPIDYFLLRRALEAGARPTALLVNFKPYLLEIDPMPNVWLYQQLLSFRECWDLAQTTRSDELFSRVVLGRLLPSVRNRTDLRDHLLAAFDGQSRSMRQANRFHLDQWRYHRGSQLTSPNPQFQPADLERAEFQSLFKTPWTPSPVMVAYARRFLQLAAENDIPVFWLMPPYSPEARTRREQRGLETAYTEFALQIQAEFPNLVVLDGRQADYPRSVFVDPSHLDGIGGTTLSAALADVLRTAMESKRTGPRWLELARFRPLDELDPSLIAAKTQLNVRRR